LVLESTIRAAELHNISAALFVSRFFFSIAQLIISIIVILPKAMVHSFVGIISTFCLITVKDCLKVFKFNDQRDVDFVES